MMERSQKQKIVWKINTLEQHEINNEERKTG